MKQIVAVLTLAACGAPSTTPASPEGTLTLAVGNSRLSVAVERVKADRGPVFCDLFNSEEGFPGPSPIVSGSIRLAASAQPMSCVFEKLPTGRYAVSVIQDENDNGQLDMSVFGAPTEGYGASNNILPPTSAPRFADSSIDVDGASNIDLVVRLLN
jgi:uncharacterized protein (DUF2141 family)